MADNVPCIQTSRKVRSGSIGQNCLMLASLFAVVMIAGGALAQEELVPRLGPFVPRYAVGAGLDHETVAALALSPLASPPLTIWNGSFKLRKKKFPFKMVGTDPAKGSHTTTINTLIVPLIFQVLGITLDPTQNIGCGGNSSAVTLVQNSPIFQSTDYSLNGTDVGDTQYTDAFQRANFWTTVSGSAMDYHVLLGTPTVAAPITVNVPPSHAGVGNGGCGNIGAADINWFNKVEVPKLLKTAQIQPNMLPIFITYNAFFFAGKVNNCCIIGFHNAVHTTKGAQTFAEAAFTAGVTGIDDIQALGHEVAEWMDDPFTHNPTPRWGHIGQVAGCQNNLEVGDPLSGTQFSTLLDGFTYHVQDLAFVPWFAQAASSFSVNGWFSFFGTFLSSAIPCS